MKDFHKTLFPYAYNILGSAEDAKDAVQEVLSNYITVAKEDIANEKSYLVKSVINQSLNIKNKRKKLVSDESWLPEPYATDETDANINLRDIVSYSLLVLLEKLNPKERAVFILKEGFGYTHEEIADVLSSTVENSRKLLSRAKEKLKPAKRSIKVSNPPVNEFLIVEKYINAIRGRDIPTLEHLLTYDISAYADGGDKIKVVKKICVGLQEVIELQMYVYHTFNKNISIANCVVNHQPALLYYQEGKIRACQVFDISVDGKIFRIYTVIDPQKLKTLEMSWQNGQLTHRVDL